MTADMEAKRPLPLRILRWVFSLLLALLLAAVCYVAVLIAGPVQGKDAEPVPTEQPLLAASPALTAPEEGSLSNLADTFPVQVMTLLSGTGMRYVSGMSADVALEGGYGRIASLQYQQPTGGTLLIQTYYPARALSLLDNTGWTLTGEGSALCGFPSVRMESSGAVRLHAQGANALYVVTASQIPEAELNRILRSLTLRGSN